jgi:pyruvate dehydrogenase E2 component (dihydrolipoamide acetyltransferase)
MAISVVMPALEMAQETGKLISWLKKEGDAVAKGEPLLEIETDKAVMEVESPGDGVLAGVKAQAGAEVQVGRTIAWIVKPGETAPADEAQVESGRKIAASVTSSSGASVAGVVPALASRDVRISPKARRLAAEKGVDLASVTGTGPGGEILGADILAAAGRAEEPVAPRAESLSPIARLMAERTAQSWTTIPHFVVARDVDATALNQARLELGPAVERRGAALSHTDLLVALVARVLARHRLMNASWTGDGVRQNAEINVGIAVAVREGVVAPVIARADQATLGEIAGQREELVERARGGKLRPPDLNGATFTVSNLGIFGVDAFSAIIVPPQAAILAIGRIADRVVAVDGQVVIRPMMTLTLSCDHRVVDGARAAEFLRDLDQAVVNPQAWLG